MGWGSSSDLCRSPTGCPQEGEKVQPESVKVSKVCVCVWGGVHCGWWKFLELGVISNHHYCSRGLWASHFSSVNLDFPVNETEMPQVPLGCLGTKW